MLDKRTATLLKIINQKCAQGSYRVVNINDLIDSFPQEFGADVDLIKQSIQSLSYGGFISVRFDRDGEYCLAPTPKGRLYSEETLDTPLPQKSPITDLLPHFYNFLSTFLAVSLAFFVIKLCGGLC